MRSPRAVYLLSAIVFWSASAYGQAPTGAGGAWSGTIVYSSCNADEAFAESPECFRAAPGASLALYDDTNRVTYALTPQEKVTFHPGAQRHGSRGAG